MCTKTDLIRFPHLHTIKLCSGPLRRMTTKWKTYERIYIALTNKSRKLISLEQSVSCLLVVEACLLLFWLLAASGRFRLDPETSGFRSVVRTHCFKDMTGKFKLHFLCLKKTDNVLIEEEHSLFWWETAGVLPISHWIYIISEIAAGCNVLSFSFLFFCTSSKRKLALDWQALLSILYQERWLFGKSFELGKNMDCTQIQQVRIYKGWQINVTDGAENVRCDCALQRLTSAFHPLKKNQ